jgi:hypothetical protein
MVVEAHLASLQRKHTDVDRELTHELAHPASDPLRIAELKRRKLKLKDQIAQLRDQTVH